MSLLPQIEKVTRDATITHFLLMFGYKLFSLYFPLFLVVRGFSLPQVGYAYLLIYLPIALFSPIVGFLNHKINPAALSTIGIVGYGIYALGMILFPNPFTFYLLQVLLGISAALFFVSIRAILMSSRLENPDRAFGWFYSASFYADAFAPAVGAIFIWKFNFVGVFIFSLIMQFFTAFFCFAQLKKQIIKPLDRYFSFRKFSQNYQKIFPIFGEKKTLSLISISFSVLLLAGFYQAFFVLFLKNLGWSQSLILVFISAFSILFLPLSLFLIHRLGRLKSEKNIFQGGMVFGGLSILFGSLQPFLNFLSVLIINLIRAAGGLTSDSGRSGLLTQKLKENPEEAGAIDTIFSPLGVALGALIGGTIIGYLGYQLLFVFGGLFVVLVALLAKRIAP